MSRSETSLLKLNTVFLMGFLVCCLAHRGSTVGFLFVPVFQWCCSAPRGSLGVGRNTFLSSPQLCFIIVFICDLSVSRGDPLMS